MIGLIALAVVALYVGLCWYVFAHLKNRWAKAAAVVVALAIPFWDLPIGYLSYRNLCSVDSGLHVYKKFSPQEKVFFDSPPSSSANELLRRGFKVVEITRADGKGIARHEIGPDRRLVTRVVGQPESEIRVSIHRDQQLSWNISREDRLVRSQSDNQLLARYSSFRWQGGWIQKVLSPLLGPGLVCSLGPRDPIVALLVAGA